METRYDAYFEREIPYKCSLEELYENVKEFGFHNEYLLAYIRQVGARNVRFYTDENAYEQNRPEHKILYRLCDEKDYGPFKDCSYNPMIEETFHENSWYSSYKLGIIPVNSKDGGKGIRTFYVSDFCHLLNEGIIEIWEMGEEK